MPILDRWLRPDERPLAGANLVLEKLIDAHGGELALESASGQGTAFRFSLPGAR